MMILLSCDGKLISAGAMINHGIDGCAQGVRKVSSVSTLSQKHTVSVPNSRPC